MKKIIIPLFIFNVQNSFSGTWPNDFINQIPVPAKNKSSDQKKVWKKEYIMGIKIPETDSEESNRKLVGVEPKTTNQVIKFTDEPPPPGAVVEVIDVPPENIVYGQNGQAEGIVVPATPPVSPQFPPPVPPSGYNQEDTGGMDWGAGYNNNGGVYNGGYSGGYGGGYNASYPYPSYGGGYGAGVNIGMGNYNIVRPATSCPLLTTAARDDQDIFGELQNYFRSYSQKAECSQASLGITSGMNTISQLETMMNMRDSNGMRCYSKNIEQIINRNMAIYYAEKGMDNNLSSDYYNCSSTYLEGTTGTRPGPAETKNCIVNKYQNLVGVNEAFCKEVVVPQVVQEKINQGMIDLERVLVQALSQKGECAPSSQETFKVAMNTFLKVKSLSAIGPWGVAAGFGADIIGSLLDKFFPSDAQKASNLMNDILSEDNFEQNACLYYNTQQKMYCSDNPITVDIPNTPCKNPGSNNDLTKLSQLVQEVKKITENVNSPSASNPYGYGGPAIFDSEKLEPFLEDLTKYAKSSEPEIRERIRTLPKVKQAKELAKINRFYSLLDQYQNFDPNNPNTIGVGQVALDGLVPLLFSPDSNQKIDFDQLVLKTTPSSKLSAIKQSGIANSIEALMANNEAASFAPKTDERSRSMAKYNKYKNAMTEMAQSQFKGRLEKQFNELGRQINFVSKRDNGVINDLVSEGLLRNIIRHCTLMQEIYDPKLEGKRPSQCQKLSCGNENRLNWFSPKTGESNYTNFKKSFCEKNFTYKKIEDDFIKELKNKNGGTICGKKAADFFSNSLF